MIFLKTNTLENWAYYYDVFSKEECDEIVRIGKQKTLQKGQVTTTGNLDTHYRKSDVSWLDDLDVSFVYRRLVPLVNEANSKYFNFDLFGFTEDFQFTEYKEPNGSYKYHIDTLYNGPIRKLSMVVQLTEEDQYEGGNLELLIEETPEQMSRKRGSVFLFPSYVLHRVTPVTSGTRYSLVTWLGGPPFK